MNKKINKLVNLIFNKLKNYKSSASKISKKDVEELVDYLINSD